VTCISVFLPACSNMTTTQNGIHDILQGKVLVEQTSFRQNHNHRHTFLNVLLKWKTIWKMISVERWNVFFICFTCGHCQWFCGPMLALCNMHSCTSCIWMLRRICPVDLPTLFTSSCRITHNPRGEGETVVKWTVLSGCYFYNFQQNYS
jgi:hypothetical protein